MLNGSAKHHPERRNRHEPQPIGDLTDPPPELSEEQKSEWTYAIENAPPALLRRLDRNMFMQWVVASADLNEAEKILRVEGKVVNRGGDQRITVMADGRQVKTIRSASKVPNPWVKVRRDAFDRMLKATSELGFSPTSRTRITLGGSKEASNRFTNNAGKRRA